jgi:hypothetical protein
LILDELGVGKIYENLDFFKKETPKSTKAELQTSFFFFIGTESTPVKKRV